MCEFGRFCSFVFVVIIFLMQRYNQRV